MNKSLIQILAEFCQAFNMQNSIFGQLLQVIENFRSYGTRNLFFGHLLHFVFRPIATSVKCTGPILWVLWPKFLQRTHFGAQTSIKLWSSLTHFTSRVLQTSNRCASSFDARILFMPLRGVRLPRMSLERWPSVHSCIITQRRTELQQCITQCYNSHNQSHSFTHSLLDTLRHSRCTSMKTLCNTVIFGSRAASRMHEWCVCGVVYETICAVSTRMRCFHISPFSLAQRFFSAYTCYNISRNPLFCVFHWTSLALPFQYKL